MSPSTPTLRVASVSPAVGSTTGDTSITVAGTEFGTDSTLTVGGVAATNLVVQTSTTLTGTIGTRPTAGPSDVVVTSAGKSATLVNGFTFIAPSGTNQPPVITSVRSIGSRLGQPSAFGDLDETLTLIPSVTDAETSPNALTYEWSGPGTFSGTGGNIDWRIPASIATTPDNVALTLNVTESFVENGVTHKNVTRGTFTVNVHNSQKEILDMGEDFLTLFSRSEISTNEVLRNFSPTCDGGRGRDDEKSDVDANRATYVQDFSKFRIARNPPVSFNFGGRCPFRFRAADACSAFTVHWEVIKRSSGQREVTEGIDFVTAVLEGNTWRLCHSDFTGTSTNLTTGIRTFVTW